MTCIPYIAHINKLEEILSRKSKLRKKHNSYIKIFSAVLLSFFLFNCKNVIDKEVIKKEKIFSLNEIEEISFYRSYADHQYLNDKQLDSLSKTNAILEDYSENHKKEKLFNRLESLSIIESNGLIEKRFEKDLSKKTNYLDNNNKIEFSYSSNFKQSNSIDIKITVNKKVINKNVDFDTANFIGLIIEDIDKDNIKEILILQYFYFMNGDHYLMRIFKLNN